jgi:hypothetical protein
MKPLRSVSRWAPTLALALVLFAVAVAAAHDNGKPPPPPFGFGTYNVQGRYVAGGISWDVSATPPVPYSGDGFLVFDGKGNLTAGEQTINYGSAGTGDLFTCDLSGTYTVDPTTGRVVLTATVSPGPAIAGTVETSSSNSSQCSGTAVYVGYVSLSDGLPLLNASVSPAATTDTPLIDAHVWTRSSNFGNDQH